MKRKAVKSFNSVFVSDLKKTNPSKWNTMANKIGAVDQMSFGDIEVESLSDCNNQQSVQLIAEHFAAISNEYSTVDYSQLPS